MIDSRDISTVFIYFFGIILWVKINLYIVITAYLLYLLLNNLF